MPKPLLIALLLLTLHARAEDWPQWRGPRGDGTSTEANLPTTWSPAENIKWKVPLPGKGHGSPVVVGDRVFLNTAIEKENQRILLCLDRATGKTLWQRVVLTAPLERKHPLNSYASSTPYCDGQRVYVTFLDVPTAGRTNGQVLVAAYDLDGNEIWRKHVGKFSSIHGWSCSPVPYADSIIVNCDHDGDGYVVRLRRDTGEQVWRIDRPHNTRSYCNPTIFDVAGTRHMVMTGSKCTASYDPDTGKPRWIIDGPTEQFAASAVSTQGTFFITGGFPRYHTLALTPDGKTLWHQKGTAVAAYVPSPVATGPWLFLVTDEGRSKGVCLDARTGEILWSKPLGQHHRPSALLANGNIYWLSDEGTTYVVKASAEFQLVSKNDLGEPANAAPASSRGNLFIRTDQHLWCIGN